MKRRIIALFLILLSLAATLGVRALSSPALERFIRDELAALARDQLGAAISVGQVDHNFLLTRLSLYDVVLSDMGGGGGKPITVRRIEAAIDPFSPLRGRLSLREVRVEGVEVVVERLADGAFQVLPFAAFPKSSGGAGGGLSTRVDSLSLLNAAVTYRDRVSGVEASLSGAMLNLRRGLLDPEGRYRVTVGAREGSLTVRGAGLDRPLPLHALQGRFIYDPEQVTVETLSLLLGPASVEYSGAIPLAGGPLAGSVVMGFELAELPWRAGLSGRVTLEGKVRGDLSSPSFRGLLSARSLSSGAQRVEDVRADLALDRKGASLGDMSLKYRGETMRGEMAVAFAAGLPFRARADLAGFPLGKLLTPERPQGGGMGRLDLRAEVTGRLAPEPGEEGLAMGLGGGVTVLLDASSGRSRSFTVRADGLYRDGTLAVTRALVSSGPFAMKASGTAASAGPRFALTLSDPSLAAWSTTGGWAKGLAGALAASATVTGSWAEPVAKGEVRLSHPAWGGYRADLAEAHVEADGRGVRTPLATVRLGKGVVSLSGGVSWGAAATAGGGKGAGEGRVRLSLVGGRLEELIPALGGGVRGAGEVAGVFEAVRSNAGWTGKGEVTGRGVKVEGEAADLVRVPFRLDQGRLTLESSVVERAGKALLLSGTVEGGAFDLLLETRGPFPLEQVAVFTTIHAPLSGEVEVRAKARGRLDALPDAEVDAVVSSAALFYGGKSWRGTRADIRIRKKNLTAEGTLFDGRVKATVSLGLLGQVPFRGDLTCERLTSADLNDFLQIGLPATVEGEVFATVGAEGFLADTQTTRATGTIEKARFSVSELAFTVQKPVAFTYHPPDGVAFSGLVLKTGESVLRGDIRIGRAGELGGAIKGEIDITGFPFLDPTVTGFSGNCAIELVAGGTVSAPRLEGYADLTDVSCTAHLPFALACRGLSGRIEVLRDRLRFSGIAGEAGGGRLEMEGDLYFRGTVPFRGQLSFTGERVAIAYPEGLTAKVRASITLAFVEGKGTLRGAVLADESRYRMTVDLENLLGLLQEMRQKKPAPDGGEGNSGQGDWLVLDLTMETVNPIDADLKILRGKATGSLRLQGTASRPILGGRLDILPATIEYRGHVFTVTRGWVGFFNPRVIEPSFDVRSRATVSGLDAQGVYRDFTVDMSVVGTPAKVDLSFLSEPPLSKLDVIGLLTLGSVTSRLLEPGQSFPAAQAALLLTSQLKGDLERGVQSLIGFDRFVITPPRVSATGDRDVWVQVDKRLGDRLRLTYATPVGGTSGAGQEVELRYRVTDVFSILGSQKGENRVGVDLDFSFEIP